MLPGELAELVGQRGEPLPHEGVDLSPTECVRHGEAGPLQGLQVLGGLRLAKAQLEKVAKMPRKETLPSRMMSLPGSTDPIIGGGGAGGMGAMGGSPGGMNFGGAGAGP